MALEIAVSKRLAADAGFLAVVSDRFYGGRRPKGLAVYPAATYQRVSTPRYNGYQLSGASNVYRGRIEVRTYGKTYADARNGIYAARACLDGQHWKEGTVRVIDCLVYNDFDEVGQDQDVFICVMVFDFTYQE